MSTNAKAYCALAIVCFIWGTTFLATRIGIHSIPSFMFAAMRHIIAGIIFCSTFYLRNKYIPKWTDVKTQILIGLFMIVFANGVVAYAVKYVGSGLATLICSMVPIWVILINLASTGKEKVNWQIITGSILGFLGLTIVFRDHLAELKDPHYLWGIIIIVIASFCWSLGTIIAKNNFSKRMHPFLASGIQILSGGLVLAFISPFVDDYSMLKFDLKGISALAYLIIFGSLLAFGCFSYALSKLPATIVSLYAYINPIVALILGWLILNEKLNESIGIAAIIIIGGVYLVNRGNKLQRT
ncbi:DMT family transporter [Solitalea koreensis]|uniref:Permease of the drug/metabolite transporter (DMT) superfamily n=1 Tax=Solitalea koreensis TaxID=543615 RepID=A0A521DP91_9SPHI|nr:EamA family transporter [Solitalea koreensis]SMO73422.1 Permease of the drug/metabolite transporter (DMT) superfamily [Solitalea koreensis]